MCLSRPKIRLRHVPFTKQNQTQTTKRQVKKQDEAISIKKKIDPGKSFDKDLYALSEDEVKKLPTVCGSLREAMQNLDKDRNFLTQGGVFTDDQIDAYIDLKFQEIYKFEHTPHPIEFEMYYSG